MLTCLDRGLAMSEPLTNCRIAGGGHFAHFMHEWKVVGPLTRKPLHKRGVEVVWIEVVDVVSDEKGEFAIVELELVDGKLVTGFTHRPADLLKHIDDGDPAVFKKGIRRLFFESGHFLISRASDFKDRVPCSHNMSPNEKSDAE